MNDKFYNNIPYHVKTVFLTALLTVLSLQTKQATSSQQKQESDFMSKKVGAFNSVYGMNYSNTYVVDNLSLPMARPSIDTGFIMNNVVMNNDSVVNSVQFAPDNNIKQDNNIKPKIIKKKPVAKKPKVFKPQTFTSESGLTIIVDNKSVKYIYPDGSTEIRQGGTLAWRNKNPGCIRSGWGAVCCVNRFAVFASEEDGFDGVKALLCSDGYRNLTLKSAIFKYAPPTENNTRSYQQRLAKITGVELTKKVCDLTEEELNLVVLAIKQIEGWEPGKLTYIESILDTIPTTQNIVDTLRQREY